MLRHAGRERRSDVKDVPAFGNRFGPAFVAHQIGMREGKRVARLGAADLQHRKNIGFAPGRAHRGAHAVASVQKRKDAMSAEKAGPAGHKHQIAAHAPPL